MNGVSPSVWYLCQWKFLINGIFEMEKLFAKLNPEEKELMLKVPAMITILIAGADDDIDEAEMSTATKILKYKSLVPENMIMEQYIKAVNLNFEDDVNSLLNDYPGLAELRNPIIAKQLEKLNTIFPKLNPDFNLIFYKSIKRFAKSIAEASGGVFGFFSISGEEKYWLELDMIHDPAAN